jgi:hypothetical protein
MRRLPCLHRLFTAVAVAGSLVLAAAQPALANICRSIEAELASVSRGPSSRERQIAGRAAVEAQRLYAHMRSIGCDRQTFLFFGQPPPPECRGYRGQLAQLQSASRAAYGPDEGRRRQLMSMLVSNNCRTSPNAPDARSGPLTAGLFDDGTRRRGEISSDDIDRPRIEARIRGAGGKAVCVRTCDGYYFPLHMRGAALQEDGDKVCQSLCPATETRIFFNPGEIENARSPDGETYSDLENAFRYRKTYDASCFCRRPGEAIGEGQARILNPPDRVSGEGFDVLNRDPDDDAPLRGMTPVPGRKQDTRLFGNRPPPAPPAPPQPPPDVPADRMVTSEQGEVREMRGKDGVTRSVRVIAPELSRAPSEAATPSAQGRAPAP